jgi:hypothetical protein
LKKAVQRDGRSAHPSFQHRPILPTQLHHCGGLLALPLSIQKECWRRLSHIKSESEFANANSLSD